MKIHGLAAAADGLLCLKYDHICAEESGAVDAICLETNGNVAGGTLQIWEGEAMDRIYIAEIKTKLYPKSLKDAMKQIGSSVRRLKRRRGAVAVLLFNEECPKPYREDAVKYVEEMMKELRVSIYVKCPDTFLGSIEPEQELRDKIEALERIAYELA